MPTGNHSESKHKHDQQTTNQQGKGPTSKQPPNTLQKSRSNVSKTSAAERMNPGLPRDRRKYEPLYYHGIETARFTSLFTNSLPGTLGLGFDLDFDFEFDSECLNCNLCWLWIWLWFGFVWWSYEWIRCCSFMYMHLLNSICIRILMLTVDVDV